MSPVGRSSLLGVSQNRKNNGLGVRIEPGSRNSRSEISQTTEGGKDKGAGSREFFPGSAASKL